LYKNSGKFPQCIISPENFTPWKLSSPWETYPWKTSQQKLCPPPHPIMDLEEDLSDSNEACEIRMTRGSSVDTEKERKKK
jgi:hypothetical protein